MNYRRKIQETIQKNKWFIPALILIDAFLIRVIFAYAMPVKLWDETIYLNLGTDLSHNLLDYSFSHGWSDFIPSSENSLYGYPQAGFRAPELPYLIALFHLLQLSPLINLIMPLIGTLSVIIVYLLGKSLFNKRVGIIAAVFFSFVPLHLFYSGKILTEVLATCFITLTFYSFWKGFEKGSKKHKLFFGIFFALSLLARYTAIWILPVLLLYLAIRDKSFKFLHDKYLWYSVVAFLIVLTPWSVYGILTYGNPIGPFIHGALASAYWGGIQPWYFFFTEWWQMFSVLGLVFVIALFYLLVNRDYLKKEIYLLLFWFAIYLGIAICLPHKEDRFILPILPAITLISAYFIDKNKYYKKIVTALVMILLFSSGLNFYNYYTTYHNVNTTCFGQVVSQMNSIQDGGLVVSENPSLFRYYAGHQNTFYPKEITEKTIKNLSNSTDKKVYFVFTRFNSGFETEKWKTLNKLMKENAHLVFACSLDKEVNWIYANK
jgi:4-amino-4-deoxy-L-arabinose transferase-like glycosyltransferase